MQSFIHFRSALSGSGKTACQHGQKPSRLKRRLGSTTSDSYPLAEGRLGFLKQSTEGLVQQQSRSKIRAQGRRCARSVWLQHRIFSASVSEGPWSSQTPSTSTSQPSRPPRAALTLFRPADYRGFEVRMGKFPGLQGTQPDTGMQRIRDTRLLSRKQRG